MKYDDLTAICNDINSCPFWKNNSTECGRDITAKPKIVEIRNTQRILLITRDPSNQANKLNSVTEENNKFFKHKILPILFEKYKEKDFEFYRDKFLDVFYWTHYQKCFPGITKKGHKMPTKECAKKYLRKEIIYSEPEYIIAMGSHAVEFVTGKKLLDSIKMNGNISILHDDIIAPIFSITHPSNANGSKSNPAYKFKKTIGLIQNIVKKY